MCILEFITWSVSVYVDGIVGHTKITAVNDFFLSHSKSKESKCLVGTVYHMLSLFIYNTRTNGRLH